MRGKVCSALAMSLSDRITPAYAGKRELPSDWTPDSRDHPRLCGEKQKRFIQKTAKSGSPPPMRGKVK